MKSLPIWAKWVRNHGVKQSVYLKTNLNHQLWQPRIQERARQPQAISNAWCPSPYDLVCKAAWNQRELNHFRLFQSFQLNKGQTAKCKAERVRLSWTFRAKLASKLPKVRLCCQSESRIQMLIWGTTVLFSILWPLQQSALLALISPSST